MIYSLVAYMSSDKAFITKFFNTIAYGSLAYIGTDYFIRMGKIPNFGDEWFYGFLVADLVIATIITYFTTKDVKAEITNKNDINDMQQQNDNLFRKYNESQECEKSNDQTNVENKTNEHKNDEDKNKDNEQKNDEQKNNAKKNVQEQCSLEDNKETNKIKTINENQKQKNENQKPENENQKPEDETIKPSYEELVSDYEKNQKKHNEDSDTTIPFWTNEKENNEKKNEENENNEKKE